MLKRLLLTAVLLILGCVPQINAQTGVCGSPSTKLICVFPQLYSSSGGVNLPNQAHAAHFDNDFEQNAAALNAAVGTALTARTLASPASGLTFRTSRT